MDRIKKFISYSEPLYELSEGARHHIENNLPISDPIFRPGSDSFYSLIQEFRYLFENNKVDLIGIDKILFSDTDLGRFGVYEGKIVPLDLPILLDMEIKEGKYEGRDVKLNKPMRSSGPKKYKVYVKNPQTNKIVCVNFGDVKGGLREKIYDLKARKSFIARHNCDRKWKPEDKLSARYWSCHLPRYKNIVPGSYNGYW
jgi:hypothetical protein